MKTNLVQFCEFWTNCAPDCVQIYSPSVCAYSPQHAWKVTDVWFVLILPGCWLPIVPDPQSHPKRVESNRRFGDLLRPGDVFRLSSHLRTEEALLKGASSGFNDHVWLPLELESQDSVWAPDDVALWNLQQRRLEPFA